MYNTFTIHLLSSQTGMSSKHNTKKTTPTQPPDRSRPGTPNSRPKTPDRRSTSRGRPDDYSKGYTEALCDVKRNIVNMINDQETDNEDNDEESSDDEEQGSDEEDGNEEDEYDDDDANQTERDQINDLIDRLNSRLEDLN